MKTLAQKQQEQLQKLQKRIGVHFEEHHVYTLFRSITFLNKKNHFVTNSIPYATVVIARKPGNVLWTRAIAVCSPKDQFSYFEGHKKVLGLLLSSAFSSNLDYDADYPFETNGYLHNELKETFKNISPIYRWERNVYLTDHETELIARALAAKNRLQDVCVSS